MKYYNTEEIDKADAHYNFIIGERSNGKTTAILRNIVKLYHETGKKGVIIRQMEMDIKGHRGASLFNGVVDGGMVEELTDGEWSGVKHRNRSYHLTRYDDDGKLVVDPEPFAHIFAISQSLHYKGNSYPNVGIILFDEFMRADAVYLQDEVSQLLNLISTIVRDKDMAKIYLVANTVSWNSPYFLKFGLRDVSKMEPGEIQVFTNEKKKSSRELKMRVAIEYCKDTASYSGGKPSDVYFAFDDDNMAAMITEGGFAIPEYPPCPIEFTKRNVKAVYWMITESGIIRCRLLKVGNDKLFVFADAVPVEVFGRMSDGRRDLFYSMTFSAERNHYTDPTAVYRDTRTQYLVEALRANRMFFQNNEVGENLMYFIKQARNLSVMGL